MLKQDNRHKVLLMYPTLILALTLITLQMIITTLSINTWPLSSYDMFAKMPPTNMYSYTVEYELGNNTTYRSSDFSKVSYEIYKDFNISHDLKMLDTYIKLQILRFEKRRKLKVLSTKVFRINKQRLDKPDLLFDSKGYGKN